MKYELIKIMIILSIVTFAKYIMPCPTYFGYRLLKENKISYKDLKKLNSLDFKSKEV